MEPLGMMRVPEDAHRRRRDQIHCLGDQIRLRVVSMGLDDDLQLQRGCVIAQRVESFSDLLDCSLSSGLFTNDVTEHTDKTGVEFGGQVEVGTTDDELVVPLGGIGRVECDRGGESTDNESGVLQFTASLGQAGRGQVRNRQQVGLPFNQADFDTVISSLGSVTDHLGE